MARGATLALKITGDARDGIRALDDTESRVGKFGRALGGAVAVGAGAGIAALGALGVASFQAASELQQSTGAIESVFGDYAIAIEKSAQGAASSAGLATSEYENLAAVLGSQLKGAGMDMEKVTTRTQDLIGVGADLAATFGGTTADAVSALSSVLKGELDPIERYGVSLKKSDVNARLAALGQDKLEGSALKTAEANAALAIVMEQTTSAHGAFNRELDTAAGSGAVLSATWENLKAKLGEKLLPVFAGFATWLTETGIPAFERLADKAGPWLTAAFETASTFVRDTLMPNLTRLWNEVIVPHVIPAFERMGVIIRDDVVPALQKIYNFVNDYVIPMMRDTWGPIITGVKDVFETLRGKLEENKDEIQKMSDTMKPFLEFMRDKVAPAFGGKIAQAFKASADAIGPLVDALMWINDHKNLLPGAGGAFGIIGKIGGLFGAPAGGGAAGPGVFGAPAGAGMFGAASSLAGGGSGPSTTGEGRPTIGGTTVNVTVNGALDPAAVARQLQTMLRDLGVAQGRTVARAL